MALAFAREGANVVISYLNEEEDAQVILEAIQECGVDGLLIPGDISNETHVQFIVNSTLDTFGSIGIFLNVYSCFSLLFLCFFVCFLFVGKFKQI